MYNDNNSDLDKEAIKMELSSHISSAQLNYNLGAVILELFGNTSLVSDANSDLKHYGKVVHGV